MRTLDARVDSIRTAKTVGAHYIHETANGEYVIVSLSITNELDRPKTFSPEQTQTALNSNGNAYNEAFDAENQSDQHSFLSQLEPIGPGVTQTGDVVFDVAPAVAQDVLSPKTNTVLGIGEFGGGQDAPVGAIVLRHQH